VFDTLQAYLGSVYINDFNRFGRTFRVYAQAEAQFRKQPEDIANLKMRNLNGDMVPMGAVADIASSRVRTGCRITTCIWPPTSTARARPGVSSGQATAAMERVLNETLAERLRLRVDRSDLPAEERRQHRAVRVSRSASCWCS
jgi:multidrug efflux pump subunit AcrB